VLNKSIIIGFLFVLSHLNALTLKQSVQKLLDTKMKSNQDTVLIKKAQKESLNANLALEQILYNKSVSSKTIAKEEPLDVMNPLLQKEILKTVKMYNKLVEYRKLIELSAGFIEQVEQSLRTIQDKEDIRGKSIKTYQITSKLNFLKEQYLKQKLLEHKLTGQLFKQLNINNRDEFVCRASFNIHMTIEQLKKDLHFYGSFSNRVSKKTEETEQKTFNQQSQKYLAKFDHNQTTLTMLNRYVVANENIVHVYHKEFKEGIRTFVDVLNAQIEWYESQKSYIQQDAELQNNYYELLHLFSGLTQAILSSKEVPCNSIKKELPRKKIDINKELKELLG
jgi:hypothetical protein